MIRTAHPRRRRLGLAAVLAAAASAALFLAGCSGTATPAPSKTPQAPSAAGAWGDAAKAGAPALDLGSDGALTGTDGCNRLTGSWKQDGAKLTFGDLASTRMACLDVDTWLSKARTATVSGSTLTVLGEDGAQLGTLTRASEQQTEAADGFVGSWGSTDTGKPNLAIAADGRFTGNDGCNGLTGDWKAGSDGEIRFSNAVSTLMACTGVDAKLGQLATAKVSGDTLTVFDEHGSQLVQLKRAN